MYTAKATVKPADAKNRNPWKGSARIENGCLGCHPVVRVENSSASDTCLSSQICNSVGRPAARTEFRYRSMSWRSLMVQRRGRGGGRRVDLFTPRSAHIRRDIQENGENRRRFHLQDEGEGRGGGCSPASWLGWNIDPPNGYDNGDSTRRLCGDRGR